MCFTGGAIGSACSFFEPTLSFGAKNKSKTNRMAGKPNSMKMCVRPDQQSVSITKRCRTNARLKCPRFGHIWGKPFQETLSWFGIGFEALVLVEGWDTTRNTSKQKEKTYPTDNGVWALCGLPLIMCQRIVTH